MDRNEAQEEAIRTTDGALLIISCPGSGKTTTMLRRIEYMLEAGISADRILMVTFTEAAAREMRERFAKLHAGNAITFCTIHSLCLRIINESGTARGYHILQQNELFDIVREAVRETGVFLDDFNKIRNDISRFKNTGDRNHRTEGNVDDKQFMEIVKRYEDKKGDILGYDFDDLLVLARDLMNKNECLRNRFSDRYRYIICDEYQDTNPIQKDVLYLLAQKYGNFCVVGDDDQSIYGFRGATPGLMIQFPKDFPNCKVIKMGTNYRSLPHIIETAGRMIGNNNNRFAKEIKAHRTGNGNINFVESDKRDDELEDIVKRIKKFQEEGKELRDIAILARTNQQLEDVATTFIEEGIPFTGTETLNDMYESWMFNDICAYIRLSECGDEYSRQDILRIANRPKRYLEMKILSRCEMTEKGIHRAFSHVTYVHDKIFDLFYFLKELKKLPFSEKVDFILDQIEYRKYVESYCESAGMSVTLQNTRLNQFSEDSKKFENLGEWIHYANSHIKQFKDALKKRSEGGVRLATMHRSKGLEWDTVFVIDCCDGNVPLMYNGKVSDIEEERRLFYVACTRAKNDLYITSYSTALTSKKKKEKPVASSMFVGELKRIVKAKKAKEEKKKKTAEMAEEARKDNGILDPNGLKPGMKIHHRSYGDGTVVIVNPTFYSIRFANGTKIFHR